jgi:N-acetyltransferase 10
VSPPPSISPELAALQESLADTPHVNSIINLARTIDQATAILSFLECCTSLKSKHTCALTAGRGRGKSAAIGLCLAGAVAFNYSNIFVTAPEITNTVTIFEFIIKGLNALHYTEHLDYTISYGAEKHVCGIAIHRDHKQSIKYVRAKQCAN